MVRGETQFNRISRFIEEIPRYLLNYRGDGSLVGSQFADQFVNIGFPLGGGFLVISFLNLRQRRWL